MRRGEIKLLLSCGVCEWGEINAGQPVLLARERCWGLGLSGYCVFCCLGLNGSGQGGIPIYVLNIHLCEHRKAEKSSLSETGSLGWLRIG